MVQQITAADRTVNKGKLYSDAEVKNLSVTSKVVYNKERKNNEEEKIWIEKEYW